MNLAGAAFTDIRQDPTPQASGSLFPANRPDVSVPFLMSLRRVCNGELHAIHFAVEQMHFAVKQTRETQLGEQVAQDESF